MTRPTALLLLTLALASCARYTPQRNPHPINRGAVVPSSPSQPAQTMPEAPEPLFEPEKPSKSFFGSLTLRQYSKLPYNERMEILAERTAARKEKPVYVPADALRPGYTALRTPGQRKKK